VRQSRRLAGPDDERTAQAIGGGFLRPAAGDARRAHDRRDAARLRGGGLVRDRGAAENARSDRRQDQRRCERGVGPARNTGSFEGALRGSLRWLGRPDGEISPGRDRPMGRRDQVGEDRDTIDVRHLQVIKPPRAGGQTARNCGSTRQNRVARSATANTNASVMPVQMPMPPRPRPKANSAAPPRPTPQYPIMTSHSTALASRKPRRMLAMTMMRPDNSCVTAQK